MHLTAFTFWTLAYGTVSGWLIAWSLLPALFWKAVAPALLNKPSASANVKLVGSLLTLLSLVAMLLPFIKS